MGWIGCVRCKKFRRDFVARTFALARPFCTEFRKATKQSRMHPNSDEDTTSTSTPAAPSPASPDAPPPQAPPSGPITRARARELNFVMLLKNEGPEE